MIFKITLLVIAISLPIISFECYLRNFGRDADLIRRILKKRIYRVGEESLLGEANFTENFDFHHNGKLIYRQEVQTDEFGRRESYPKIKSEDLALFFGCSFVYGDALMQHQTLPYLFSKKTKIDSYNYAKVGFGPNHILRQIELLPLDKQIPFHYRKINPIYIFYDFHMARAVGSFSWISRHGGGQPAYKYISSRSDIMYLGTFAESRPLSTYFYYWLGNFHATWYFPDSILRNRAEEINLFCSLMNKSYELLKVKFGDRLQLMRIVAPTYFGEKIHVDFLKDVNACLLPKIRFMSFEIKGGLEKWSIDSQLETHPNEQFNQVMSDFLQEKILNTR